MNILDILTVFSYIALNADILFQIRKIYITKSSRDISLAGITIRYIAILVILIKFLSLSDIALVIGQALIVVTFTTYITLAFVYFFRRRKET